MKKENKMLQYLFLIVITILAGIVLEVTIIPKDEQTPFAFVLFIFIGMTVIFLIAEYRTQRVNKLFNATHIKNLNENLYGYYADLTRQFTYQFDPNETGLITNIASTMNQNARLRLEHFIVMLMKHDKLLYLYKNKFESLKHSEASYYQLVHIYSLYYLLENDITKFQIHYSLYKDTIHLRTESRVLGERLERIQIGSDYYDIPVYLLDLMFQYYVKDKAIDHLILSYHPKCPLDELIYITILYHYLEVTENSKLLLDIEDEYMKYKEKRKNL
jgi:hypothetical protein